MRFALEGRSDCLRLELAPFGVYVVVIEPGGSTTEWAGSAVQRLLDRSGSTAYVAGAKQWAKLLRPRYVAGTFAALILTARRLFGERAFDSVMMFLGRTARP